MRFPVVALVCLLPLAIAPGWFFYYDVTPKAALLLAGCAAFALLAAWKPHWPLHFMTLGYGKWNTILAGASIAVLILAAARSQYPSLAWNGSVWRQSGAIVQIATVAAAILSAALVSRSRGGLLALLRALSVAGILAGFYAILQYFGVDPWLDASAYHFGEGSYEIVRPPGTMGHSNYLAAFLLWPVFAGAGLYRTGSSRVLGASAALVAAGAIILSGSRGALLGLFVGAVVQAACIRERRLALRKLAAPVVLAAIALGAFYLSPAGARLRARVFWATEDSAGGARLLLWRDSLRMSADRIWTGFGPDAFVAAFPLYESAELARAYPDFYHESPHNMFLDALLDQGLPGAALQIAWLALGLIAGWRGMRTRHGRMAAALLPGLAAAAVAHQFAVLVIPAAFLFLLTISVLCGAGFPVGRRLPNRRSTILATRALAATAAVLLLIPAYGLTNTSRALASAQVQLTANPAAAAESWQSLPAGAQATAGLYFSRRFAEAATQAPDAISKLRFAQLAGMAAATATQNPEQRQNAFYNLATLQAAANDPAAVEASLRGAIAAAPTWFKPHWALARLLQLTNRIEEARHEARLALDLNGHRDTEVIETMREILSSPTSEP